jgi:hypothetical protein
MAIFQRKYKRSVNDIYENTIKQRAEAWLQDTAQKWVHHCKTNHRWRNRTGALENSISWGEIKKNRTGFETTIEAGGLSKVRYSFDYSLRTSFGLRKRRQAFVLTSARSGAFTQQTAGRGDMVYVNYAQYVENKGYDVLRQGKEYVRKHGAAAGARLLRIGK